MRGHLLLDCAKGTEGKTFLRRQSFRAPMYLNKPYWEGNFLIVNAINPTAGLFPGDSVDISIHVGENTRVVFTSPSANRIHRSKTGDVTVRQHFDVEDGAWLDVFPELLIPHRDSRYVQDTSIDLRHRSGIFFTEMMAPGRVAFEEAFVFQQMEMRTTLRLEGKVIALDNYRLSPEDGSIHALQDKNSYYAACFLFSNSLPASPNFQRLIYALSNDRATATASSFPEGLIAMRIIADDSISLKKIIAEIRTLVYRTIGEHLPILRKQ